MDFEGQHLTNTEEYEEELRSSLVCGNNAALKKAISAALEQLKYNSEYAENPEDAFEKIKYNQYGLIILDEVFGGTSLENNGVYKYLLTMPMAVRRNIFIALMGKDFKTADNMTAFAKSVNLVLNERDISNLKPLLKKAIPDNDQFYKVFLESIKKTGNRQ